MSLETEYLRMVKERFKSVRSLGDKIINQLSEDDIHWRLNEELNKVAVIVEHMSGK